MEKLNKKLIFMSKYFKKNNGKRARNHPRLRKNASRLLAPTTATTTTAAALGSATSVGTLPGRCAVGGDKSPCEQRNQHTTVNAEPKNAAKPFFRLTGAGMPAPVPLTS